jgi:hypothetical protein
MWNRRLYLFWPIFLQKSFPQDVTIQDGSLSGATPDNYWEIKLACLITATVR